MKTFSALLIATLCVSTDAFVGVSHKTATTAASTTTTTTQLHSTTAAVELEPKEVVKVFGRLAEKYIMLDESGGMCCYSACKDCEFRLPDGGYKMADQSAARPKWIPTYEERVFAGQGKEHTAKWKSEIFPEGTTAVNKEEFAQAVAGLEFATPLGGPFVSKSAGSCIEDTLVAESLFEILAEGKDVLTRHKMGVALGKLSEGESGLTWPKFSAALGL
eukprot:CAMPEP_0116146500 /NCGR_PEP_ID=MMETSP0329-20121206/17197_1 /TAXON_ID=697910 /ORGANISM="Pseudo-nitzschia arenysensis, Strain B593" /LENGTH=217 /DNA_ID=CAMNT_0003642251 /DNA_START=45 /DNA_END=698 /DNA_ORIENTATION=+